MNGIKKYRISESVWFYIAGFLLGGVLHVADNMVNTALYSVQEPAASALPAFSSTLLFALNLLIYCTLIFLWIQSVYERLLPSVGRICTIAAAVLMLVFLLIRSAKYRLVDYDTLLEHILWYAYYVPLVGIPGLFLITCLSMGPERRNRKWLMLLVLALAGLLVLGVATNDVHLLMFCPTPDNLPQSGRWSTYYTGPLWYVVYGFVILCVLLGLFLLIRADRRKRWARRTLLPVLLLLGMLGMLLISDRIMGTTLFRSPWQFPETFVFFMLGIFECCIRSRLIPFNDGYTDFFAKLKLPADVTGPDLVPVDRTANAIPAGASQRSAALSQPLPLDADTRLYGKRISTGCAFWLRDEGSLHRLNEALSDANEVLESENDLLRLENEQSAERIRVDARNQVYAKAAAEVYGTQKKIAALLDRLHPEAEDYPAVLSRVLLLNAYVKRKTNFVLQAAERDTVSAQELYLALDETARFLELCGVSTSVTQGTNRPLSVADAMTLYDSFALLAEFFAESADKLVVLMEENVLRLMAEYPLDLSLPQTPALTEASVEDGLLYLSLRARKGVRHEYGE